MPIEHASVRAMHKPWGVSDLQPWSDIDGTGDAVGELWLLLNLVLQGWLGLDEPLFNIYSLAGMIWVDGLHYSPMAFLLMTAAFRSMDPSLEESAMMSGASVLQVAWKITLKLAWPARAMFVAQS